MAYQKCSYNLMTIKPIAYKKNETMPSLHTNGTNMFKCNNICSGAIWWKITKQTNVILKLIKMLR